MAAASSSGGSSSSGTLLLQQILTTMNNLTANSASKSDVVRLEEKFEKMALRSDVHDLEGRVAKIEEGRVPAHLVTLAASVVGGVSVYIFTLFIHPH